MEKNKKKKRPKLAVTNLDSQITELAKKTGHKILARWACDCAERVLPYFEKKFPRDKRPRKAIEECRVWINTGMFKMADIRRDALAAHAAAREVTDDSAACSAARAAGHALATAHVSTHAIAAAVYAVTAVRDAMRDTTRNTACDTIQGTARDTTCYNTGSQYYARWYKADSDNLKSVYQNDTCHNKVNRHETGLTDLDSTTIAERRWQYHHLIELTKVGKIF